jgi:hypothetical protein
MDYGFQRLRHGSFPAWDPSIYSGQPFAANLQAALFYPPTWILYALSAAHEHLPYRALELFVFAHIWIAFLLCFCWLRNKRLSGLACILGAGIFAFSGYAMLQLQHFGLLCGYAWLPLGLWGIDDLSKKRSHSGFFKITAASAACFLAGYPPTWLVLIIYWCVYALFSRALLKTMLALAASLFVCAVQLLPALETSSLMIKENRYGLGMRDISYYLSFLIPNFYNFGINVPSTTNFGREYLYLGAPALFGIAMFLRCRAWRPALPLIASAVVCLIFITNPLHAISFVMDRFPFLAQVCGPWYFLAGLTTTVAGVAALGIDRFLSENEAKTRWAIPALVVAIAWAACEMYAWRPNSPAFPAGWWSALDVAATLIVFAFCLFALRGRMAIVVVLFCVAIDYKAFGTSKRFNGRLGSLPHEYARDGFFAMDHRAFQALIDHREYRILVDFTAPMPVELRHHGLSTPQGFDPFLTQRYLDFVKGLGAHEDSNREFSFNIENQKALDVLGVRYVITTRNGPNFPRLDANPLFKLLGDDSFYFRVYEYKDFVKSPIVFRTPELRRFQVSSPTPVGFVFNEQFFPGWTASLDGRAIPISLWRGALQSVQVPAGDHSLEFRYRPRMLILGAWISLASIFLIAIAALKFRPGRSQ